MAALANAGKEELIDRRECGWITPCVLRIFTALKLMEHRDVLKIIENLLRRGSDMYFEWKEKSLSEPPFFRECYWSQKAILGFLSLCILSLPSLAEYDPEPCAVKDYFSTYGYDVELISNEVQHFSNLSGLESTLWAYLSPEGVGKNDYAVIAHEVSMCVQSISEDNVCIDLHHSSDSEEEFFRVCNWGVADQEPYRINVNYSTSPLSK